MTQEDTNIQEMFPFDHHSVNSTWTLAWCSFMLIRCFMLYSIPKDWRDSDQKKTSRSNPVSHQNHLHVPDIDQLWQNCPECVGEILQVLSGNLPVPAVSMGRAKWSPSSEDRECPYETLPYHVVSVLPWTKENRIIPVPRTPHMQQRTANQAFWDSPLVST